MARDTRERSSWAPEHHRRGRRDQRACRVGAPKSHQARWLPVPAFLLDELRHSAAPLAISAGAPVTSVQRMLGHASATLTLDRDGHLFPDELDAAAARRDEAARQAGAQKSGVARMGSGKRVPRGPQRGRGFGGAHTSDVQTVQTVPLVDVLLTAACGSSAVPQSAGGRSSSRTLPSSSRATQRPNPSGYRRVSSCSRRSSGSSGEVGVGDGTNSYVR